MGISVTERDLRELHLSPGVAGAAPTSRGYLGATDTVPEAPAASEGPTGPTPAEWSAYHQHLRGLLKERVLHSITPRNGEPHCYERVAEYVVNSLMEYQDGQQLITLLAIHQAQQPQ